jgi:hypothetical protein
MSYDIYFVRRDPGQSFEDALDDLEASFEHGDPGDLTDVDLENWDAIVPRARDILGELEVDDEDEVSRELTARRTGVEVRLIRGEIEIHVPDDRVRDTDSLELMAQVYELARTIEDVTGLEGYDPQVGEPVSDQPDAGTPSRRRWNERDDDDDDDLAPPEHMGRRTPREPVDMSPDEDERPRRWWEFWRP